MVPGWRNRGRGRRHRSAVQETGADASFRFMHRWGFKSGQFMALEEIPPFQVDRVGARRSEHQRTVGPGGAAPACTAPVSPYRLDADRRPRRAHTGHAPAKRPGEERRGFEGMEETVSGGLSATWRPR